jgi:hypothetical protein
MAEILLEFDDVFQGLDGRSYVARVCGRGREDGLWEGWIEFVASDNIVRTGRETTQPSRDTLVYWATGLTAGYLDGALLRTLRPTPEPAPAPIPPAAPVYDAPAPSPLSVPRPPVSPPAVSYPPRPVLDPFAVYAEGDHVLQGQLEALSEGQLRTIIRAYGLTEGSPVPLDALNRRQLAQHILGEVRGRAGS